MKKRKVCESENCGGRWQLLRMCVDLAVVELINVKIRIQFDAVFKI